MVELYADMIYRIAYHALKQKADAEDVTHNVLLRWLENAPVFTNATHEKAWFIRVTVNACKDVYKSAWYQRTVALEENLCLQREASSPSLLDEVMALPSDYSVVIYLHYFEGYRVREIARLLGENERAIQSRLYRARQQLKLRLEEKDNV